MELEQPRLLSNVPRDRLKALTQRSLRPTAWLSRKMKQEKDSASMNILGRADRFRRAEYLDARAIAE